MPRASCMTVVEEHECPLGASQSFITDNIMVKKKPSCKRDL